MNSANPQSLIAALQAQVSAEADAVRTSARDKARAILAQARHRARLRFHRVAEALRRERAEALRLAEARAARLQHRRFLAENARLAKAGLAAIEEALRGLWADPDIRVQWCRNAVEMAAARLPDARRFDVLHPPGWPEDAAGAVRAALEDAGRELAAMTPDQTLEAGLRLETPDACLDASLAGLMHDRSEIAGAYLAALGREHEGADG